MEFVLFLVVFFLNWAEVEVESFFTHFDAETFLTSMFCFDQILHRHVLDVDHEEVIIFPSSENERESLWIIEGKKEGVK